MGDTKHGSMENLLLNITYGSKYFVDAITKIRKKNMEAIMKKILALVSAALLALGLTGCTDPMKGDFLHTDTTISAIYMSPATGTSSVSVAGVIDNEAGTIKFTVPKAKRKDIDISEVKLRATVGFDAYVTPVLTGIHDLSEPFDITVTQKMTGEQKSYTLSASYEK